MGMPRRAQRHQMQRDRIVDAALAVADRVGLEAVSMRAVALEMRASPMSIYRYVRSKEDLLDAMFERVLAMLTSAPAATTWRAALIDMANGGRALLAAHPRWLPLLTRVATPNAAFEGLEHLVSRVAKRVPAWEVASVSFSAVIAYTLGFVLVEQMMLGLDGEPIPPAQIRAARAALTAGAARTRYPVLAATAEELAPFSFDAVFEVGLRALVRGLTVTAAASATTKA